MIGQYILSLFPLLIFLALYIGFFIWGRYKNKKVKEELYDDALTALDPYLDTHLRKDPNDRQIEIRCKLKEDFLVTSASFWIILLARNSFPTMLVDKLFFRNKDSFGLAANFPHTPRVVFEVIPYKFKSAIRRDFDYLIEIDDINTKSKWINDHYLIKSNRPRVINQLLKSKMFFKMLKDYHNVIQWISVRTDEPHFEFKFNHTGETTDILKLTKFCMLILKFFGKVCQKTKDLEVPIILKKEKKDTKEDKKKKESKRKKRENKK